MAEQTPQKPALTMSIEELIAEATRLYSRSQSDENLERWHVATLYPDDVDEGKDWKSISIYMNGAAGGSGETFEINDISILYRPRPIK